jgi:NAD(P)-dependent dehydrogenase (short-subunit alcohol dehydrogenase family)
MNKKIWFITGISSGLGKSLAEALIADHQFVIGTFRKQEQVDEFNAQHQNDAYAIKLDITDIVAVQEAIHSIAQKYGKIDVLVNNAGYGLAGAVEETSLEETRALFEANFFGSLSVTQAVLPLMRQQKSGHMIQISSHGGFKAFPGFGIYNASKFALEGFSEALAIEVAPLNIKVSIVEPGPFRTQFAGESFKGAQITIDDYNETAGAFRQRMKAVNGQQEGDPSKAAQAIIQLAKDENPALRVPLGKIAVMSLTAKINSVQADLDKGKAIAEACVFE